MDLAKALSEEMSAGRFEAVGYMILPKDGNPRTELERMNPSTFDCFAVIIKNKFAFMMQKIRFNNRDIGKAISLDRINQLKNG